MALGVITGRKCKLSVLRDSPIECRDIGLSREVQDTIHEGMRQACAPGGTAYPLFDFTPAVMCKTGTAQHSGQDGEGSKVMPHAWIMVGYPTDNPELVLVVFLDSAGEGSDQAGPVAKEILTRWRDQIGK